MLPRQPLRLLAALALLVAVAVAPARAQDGNDDSAMPELNFRLSAMQGAQYLEIEGRPNLEAGFQRPRVNLEVTAQFNDRIDLYTDFGYEPNDFGTGGNSFAPAVDLLFINVGLTDNLVLRLGTPVTVLFNYRYFSDGASTVQSTPLIGNSPIDFITAETGGQLIGTYGNFGFDVSITSPTFFESFEPGTGVSVIGKARYRLSEQFALGFGGSQILNGASGDRFLDGSIAAYDPANWVTGDGEHYDPFGQPTRVTHASLLPGLSGTFLQSDFRIDVAPFTLIGWGGFAFEGFAFADRSGPEVAPANTLFATRTQDGVLDITDEFDSQMWWLGLTGKVDVTETVFVAARGSFANNASDWADDDTAMWRVQGGFGFSVFDYGMLKIEGVTQQEQINSPGQVGGDWWGVSTEFSVVF